MADEQQKNGNGKIEENMIIDAVKELEQKESEVLIKIKEILKKAVDQLDDKIEQMQKRSQLLELLQKM